MLRNTKSHHQPLVTIAIPTYNRADTYLPQALRSALAQDYPALEILVSDNASTDGTPALVQSFEDPRLRYVRHEQNIGGKANWTFCVHQARGTYFLLLHDDDLIDPDFVTLCIGAAEGRDDLGIIRTGVRVINGQGAILSETRNLATGDSLTDLFRAWFRGDTAFYLASTLYSTRALQELDGFHSRKYMFDDVATLARVVARHGRADVQAIKASFRRHESNLGSRPDLVMDWAEDCLYLRDLLLELTPLELQPVMRREATPYLCAKAYKQAGRIASPAARWKAYARIYALFGFRQSPLPTLLRSTRSRVRNGLRRLIKGPGQGSQRAEHD
jgi:glycosyltransferase involved in cell wall biosynthesis